MIKRYPSPELLQACLPVEEFDNSIVKLCYKMFKTMIEHKGIGLAANQIGILQQVIVINIPKEAGQYEDKQDYHGQNLIFVNPVITASSEDVSMMVEGCLSFPGISADIKRPINISVKAQNVRGEEFITEAKGLLARCLQHEIDHLQGITMLQRAIEQKGAPC